MAHRWGPIWGGVLILVLLAACGTSTTTQSAAPHPTVLASQSAVPPDVATPRVTPGPTSAPTPVATADLSAIALVQADEHPSSTGDLGSWFFIIGSAENLDADHTARVSLQVVGDEDSGAVTLVYPVMWILPGQTSQIQAIWSGDPQSNYRDVHVAVSEVALFNVTTGAWNDGLAKSAVDCSQATQTTAPKCSVTNGMTVPLSYVESVILKTDPDPAQEYGGFLWISPEATVVAPGATERLYVAGLPTWWNTTFQTMSDSELWWDPGVAFAADQPGFGSAVR